MGYSEAAKAVMLNALRSAIGFMGLLSQGADHAVTGAASTNVLASAGHGLGNGDLVTFTALAAGTALRTGGVYYVVGAAPNAFQLSTAPGGAPALLGSDLAGGNVVKLTELSGGSYARLAVSYAAEAGGAINFTGTLAFNVPGPQPQWTGMYSALTAGSLYGLSPVPLGAGTTYVVTTSTLDLAC